MLDYEVEWGSLWTAARKQTFEKLEGIRLVIVEHVLGSRSAALKFEEQLQQYLKQRGEELMGKKVAKKGNKGGKQKNQNEQKQQAQSKKGKKK